MTEFLSRQQAAAQLQISLRKLDSLVAAEEIECYRMGRLVRFSQGFIDRYLQRVTQQVKPKSAEQPQDEKVQLEQPKVRKGRTAKVASPAREKAAGRELNELQVFGKFAKGAAR